jgi:hypothetical protein
MKSLSLILACALLSAPVITLADEDKKVTTTTTTTYGTGTITEYVPGSTFIVKEEAGPVTYHYGDSVTYVTSSGAVIPEAELRTRISAGTPVKVHYTTKGDQRVISKVEVREKVEKDKDD